MAQHAYPALPFSLTVIRVLYFYAIGLLIRQMIAIGQARGSKNQDGFIEAAGLPRPRSVNMAVASYEHLDRSTTAPARPQHSASSDDLGAWADDVDAGAPPPYTPGSKDVKHSLKNK